MQINQQKTDALVIIPTYNEKENIVLLLGYIFSLKKKFHVLVIDDASPDGTAGVVAPLQKVYPTQLYLQRRPSKLGLGTAYLAGFKFALQRDYQYILTMDADFSHASEDLDRLYTFCAQGPHDCVIGSRYVRGGKIVGWPLSRVVLGWKRERASVFDCFFLTSKHAKRKQ